MYGLWASLRLGHLREWVEEWLPKSVFSLGNGLSSVEAWFSTALDMVADVIKSFDTVDRSVLDCTLGRLGLPDWFRKAYLAYHSQVRLRFKLVGMGVFIPQGCPLSVVFTVALYVPLCRHLEVMPDVKPQLYADNLKCSAPVSSLMLLGLLLGVFVLLARMCRLVSVSCLAAVKLWDISGDGKFWKVQLDVRDIGAHLDFTRRARAGALSHRAGEAAVGVTAVGALPLVFQVKLGLVRGKYVSSSSTSAFRAAIVSKMPLANTPAILNLLDGPVGVDPAFHIVWARFRMMRGCLAFCPEEEPWILRMLDLISWGAQGHGPIYLLLTSASELQGGFGFLFLPLDDDWTCATLSRFYLGCLAF